MTKKNWFLPSKISKNENLLLWLPIFPIFHHHPPNHFKNLFFSTLPDFICSCNRKYAVCTYPTHIRKNTDYYYVSRQAATAFVSCVVVRRSLAYIEVRERNIYGDFSIFFYFISLFFVLYFIFYWMNGEYWMADHYCLFVCFMSSLQWILFSQCCFFLLLFFHVMFFPFVRVVVHKWQKKDIY